MGIGVSIFLMAAGAILAFAVDMPRNGLDLGIVGVILMLLGGVGLLAGMILWNDWHPGRRRDFDFFDEPVVTDEPVVYEQPVVRRRVTTRRSVTYDG